MNAKYLSRLEAVDLNNTNTMSMVYNPNGSMRDKGALQGYQYEHQTKVHALTEITDPDGPILDIQSQTAYYNAYNKTTRVEQYFTNAPTVEHRLEITYGIDEERMRTRYYIDNHYCPVKIVPLLIGLILWFSNAKLDIKGLTSIIGNQP